MDISKIGETVGTKMAIRFKYKIIASVVFGISLLLLLVLRNKIGIILFVLGVIAALVIRIYGSIQARKSA